jgi:polyisoprenoid-binding protein YceI
VRSAAAVLMSLALANAANAGSWKLVPAESSLHFVGIKNDAVGVVGSFTALDGAFDPDAHTGWVEVKLGSTSTGDPGRDANLTATFFEVAKFPAARFDVSGLPPADKLADSDVELAGTLALHGASLPLKIAAHVTRDSHGHLHVHNAKPVVLSAHDLGMDAQLAALKTICGHQSLSAAVPVEFDVSFAAP